MIILHKSAFVDMRICDQANHFISDPDPHEFWLRLVNTLNTALLERCQGRVVETAGKTSVSGNSPQQLSRGLLVRQQSNHITVEKWFTVQAALQGGWRRRNSSITWSAAQQMYVVEAGEAGQPGEQAEPGPQVQHTVSHNTTSSPFTTKKY